MVSVNSSRKPKEQKKLLKKIKEDCVAIDNKNNVCIKEPTKSKKYCDLDYKLDQYNTNVYNDTNLYNIFAIPLCLFILVFLSIFISNIFDFHYNLSNYDPIINQKYINKLKLSTDELIDRVRIEDIQSAMELLIQQVDNRFNHTILWVKEQQDHLNDKVRYNTELSNNLVHQLDELEKDITLKLDRVEQVATEASILSKTKNS
ncbi:uncharacterized protein CMU_031100 [Cryptosporidium muris RN66]|uniref:Uncharacterized protein n=1 Tax=Cryptosporidium muris (strain RN66) TaxID=441375 RepID=B6AIC8_CRYMR|nr:uncharacterized protein CMU_031100 [Cryptosporidium muris RN66]EEA07969.1 hypothetical protein CMU_031100 [Cryptosporidium muris RN66]|eukprot:XP_002142318.1 hypothetical protein [Cryptosporidium muris RN66]